MAWLTLDFNSRHLPLKCPSKNEKGVFNSDEPRPPPKGFPARAGEQTLPNTPVHSSRPFDVLAISLSPYVPQSIA